MNRVYYENPNDSGQAKDRLRANPSNTAVPIIELTMNAETEAHILETITNKKKFLEDILE